MGSVYLIRNKQNGKGYVGSTIKPRLRRRQHFSDLRCSRHPNIYLQRAFTKHGESAFEWVILEEAADEDLPAKEKEWIVKLSSADPEQGYNLTDEPYAPMRGKTHTPEVVAYLKQVVPKGSAHHNSKYTEGQIREVFDLHKAGYNQLQIEELTGIDNTNISLIIRGKAWKHLGLAKEQPKRRSKSGVVGVYPTKHGTWVAEMGRKNSYLYIGTFKSFEEAVAARKKAEEV